MSDKNILHVHIMYYIWCTENQKSKIWTCKYKIKTWVEREYLLVKCAGLDIAICDIHVGGLRYILTELYMGQFVGKLVSN
jgi:hypothetical protein